MATAGRMPLPIGGSSDMRVSSLAVASIVATFSVAIAFPAITQPPAHAPAHGFRAKQRGEKHFAGRSGLVWAHDYGVSSGDCDHRAIATAVGSVAGALIAHRVADDENREVATLIGAAAGALIGNRIGRSIDRADEACIGHSLELGAAGRTVSWTNPTTGVVYSVVPDETRDRDGAVCRDFTITAVVGGAQSTRRRRGCEAEPGVWQIVR